MPSGYEKSPDYGGGPPPPIWVWILAGLVIFAAPIVVLLDALFS